MDGLKAVPFTIGDNDGLQVVWDSIDTFIDSALALSLDNNTKSEHSISMNTSCSILSFNENIDVLSRVMIVNAQ